ncbi:hypothetical protein MRB53_013850 [Persea americana]|uniref:Uncharacterized protein n=1 Tax=Persea americana TaxID=3435 RepID=A0ACC2K950_PERAE|nr:hypothetical protein MRB53_013850 [Persea americana]
MFRLLKKLLWLKSQPVLLLFHLLMLHLQGTARLQDLLPLALLLIVLVLLEETWLHEAGAKEDKEDCEQVVQVPFRYLQKLQKRGSSCSTFFVSSSSGFGLDHLSLFTTFCILIGLFLVV